MRRIKRTPLYGVRRRFVASLISPSRPPKLRYSVVREVGIRLRDTGAVGSCVELNALRCKPVAVIQWMSCS